MDCIEDRSWPLQELQAHGANVNCLSLGHKSGRVLVTGGDDKKVNLWAIGKDNCIMSLGGHLTPVECVKFSHTEDTVCAGSQAGTLKQWDLEAAKLFRTLTGHKDGIKCMDFHPYGDLLASGSLDTTIKLWDSRKKASIFTYKGHNETVNSLKFSPDGQWIGSGGEEGSVRLWDLRAGKVLQELNEHTSAITDVEFHPQEFLLAASSADRTVSFWDLENFLMVSKSERETSAVKCLLFSLEGECLFGGCVDQLKVYGWEPVRIFDIVTTGWGKIQDITFARNQLIGASFNSSRVLVFVIELGKVSRIPKVKTSQGNSSQLTRGRSVRKSFNKQKPISPPRVVEEKSIDEECDTDEGVVSFIISNENDYEAAFRPHRSLNRSPPPLHEISHCKPCTAHHFAESSLEENYSKSSSNSAFSYSIKSVPKVPVKIIENKITLPAMSKSAKSPPPAAKRDFVRRSVSKIDSATQSESASAPTRTVNLAKRRSITSSDYTNTLPDVVSRSAEASEMKNCGKVLDCERDAAAELVTNGLAGSLDIHLEEFLPTSYRGSGGMMRQSSSQQNLSEGEIISSLTRNHEMVLTILKIRQRNLEIIYSLWRNQDMKCALEGAISMDDQAVLIDVLSAINKRPSLWNLDICVLLLPTISNLLQSKYEMYATVCCETLQLILRNFSAVIRTNVQWSSPTIGVDISKEERYGKCIKCYEKLIAIRSVVLKKQTMQGKLGQCFRDVQALLQAIEK